MKRRQFIKNAGITLSAPFLFNGMNVSALSGSFFNNINNDTDRVLVLINLSGGNDGLNTIVPLDQYRNLYNARTNIIIPERNLLRATDKIGLHPSMTGIKSLWDEGKLEMVQSVGYPNQNRSHFRSTEIWTSGSPATEVWSTGWLGRYFDEKYPGFPDAYPNAEHTDPFAIALGYFVSETCQGPAANFSVVLNDPFAFRQLPFEDEEQELSPYFKEELAFVKLMYAQTNGYGDGVLAAARNGRNTVNYADNVFAQQLKNVALMISGGLQTSVYVVTLGGFDTHAAQVTIGNNVLGPHAQLLQILSDGIKAFQNDLNRQGLEKRVVGMTFSEFGRQIRSNSGSGTDHGTAAPLLLFGSCVNAQILGQNPVIPDAVEDQAGVPVQFDFRDVYGSLLMDWFEVPLEKVKKLLYNEFQYLPIVNRCNLSTGTNSVNKSLKMKEIEVFPNPFQAMTTIAFSSEDEWVRLRIVDEAGKEVALLVDKKLAAGQHQLPFNGSNLPNGAYYCQLTTALHQQSKGIIKIR